MNDATFLEKEFLTIRKEIEDTHGRIFQVLVGGSTIIPLAQIVVSNNQGNRLGFVAPALPFVVVVLVLIFLAQNLALMRCGRYIKDHIEPHMTDVLGWETWMERNTKRWRMPDKYVKWSFYSLSLVYYLVSTGVAINEAPYLLQRPVGSLRLPLDIAISRGELLQLVLAVLYLVVGALTLWILLRHAQASHRTTAVHSKPARLSQLRQTLENLPWKHWPKRRQPDVYHRLAERIQQHIDMLQDESGIDRVPDSVLAMKTPAQRAFAHFCASFRNIRVMIVDLLVEEDRLIARIQLDGRHCHDWLGLPATHLPVSHLDGLWIAASRSGEDVLPAGEIDPQDVVNQLCSARRAVQHRDTISTEVKGQGEYA